MIEQATSIYTKARTAPVGRIEPNSFDVPDAVNFSTDQDASFTAGTMQLVEVGVGCPIHTKRS